MGLSCFKPFKRNLFDAKEKHENVYGKRPAYNVLGSKAIQGHLPLQAFLNLNLHTLFIPFQSLTESTTQLWQRGNKFKKMFEFWVSDPTTLVLHQTTN